MDTHTTHHSTSRRRFALLGLVPLLGWAPSQAAHGAPPAFAGTCVGLTLNVSYTPAIGQAVPASTATTIRLSGSGLCTMENGVTVVGTLTGSGTTLPDGRIVTCAGGSVAGAGTFDVPARSGFPHGITATMVISVARGTGTIALVDAGKGRVVAQGTFLQAPTGTVACLPPAGALASTTWSGAFAFGATNAL